MNRAARALIAGAVVIAGVVLTAAIMLTWRQYRAERLSGVRLVGRPAPDFRLKRLDGEPGEISLADLRGRRVLIDFFATWCPPCQRVGSAVAEFATSHRHDLITIGISFDDAATVGDIAAYVSQHHVGYPIVGDGRGHAGPVKESYGVESIPHLILIDAAGRIASGDLAGATAEETTRNLQLAIGSPRDGI